LLSSDRACFHVTRNETTRMAYRLECRFASDDGGVAATSALVARLLQLAAEAGLPAAQDALNGINDNVTRALAPLFARFNTTLVQAARRAGSPIDASFDYFVAAEQRFALSEPPYWHVESRLFDFEALSDRSQVRGTTLGNAAMRGDAVFWLNRSLASVPQRFITAGRVSVVCVCVCVSVCFNSA
jgi:hypothetical protein